MGLFAHHRQTLFGMAGKEVPADGVVTGCATIDGRLIHLASQDFTVAGGSAGEMHCDKIANMMKLSLKTGSPFIFINDSGGARVQEGIDSLFRLRPGVLQQCRTVRLGAADLLDMRSVRGRRGLLAGPYRFHHPDQQAHMFITGPAGHQAGHRRAVTAEDLGGAVAQMKNSGRGSLHRAER